METNIKEYDCQRGCEKLPDNNCNNLTCGGGNCFRYNMSCCKLSVFDWLDDVPIEDLKDLFEVRFKNTRKIIFRNTSGQMLRVGDFVVVEAQTGYDLGIVTIDSAMIFHQLKRDRIDPKTYEFRKIYRKARPADIEKWQEAIAREHTTMIRSRQMAAALGLNMKIGDVEFQGDGTKAIFYYIADERVDFRQLIKNFAEEFRIRIEMKQIGARQEAGLIGGIGVCGQALCCSRYMNNFKSITTAAARSQDLSLNPQKLAGQCGKLKCCINYEASVYVDAQATLPKVTEPLHLEDGDAYLMKTDILKGLMWFSYSQGSMINLRPLKASEVKEIIALNKRGVKAPSILEEPKEKVSEFMSAVGEDSISRFDNSKERGRRKKSQKDASSKQGKEKRENNESADTRNSRVNSERDDRMWNSERAEISGVGENGERKEAGERKGNGAKRDRRGRRDAGEKRENSERRAGGERKENGERGDRMVNSERAEIREIGENGERREAGERREVGERREAGERGERPKNRRGPGNRGPRTQRAKVQRDEQ